MSRFTKPLYLALLAAAFGSSACTTRSLEPQAAADGSSPERAVVIHEDDTPRGIAAENRWLRGNLPSGCTKTGQALIRQNGGIYDRITVECPGGRKHNVWFDIQHFFGRYNGRLLGQ